MRLRVARQRDDDECDRGDALLAVDEHERRDAARRHRTVLDPDHRACEVRGASSAADSKDVLPELPAILLVPRVGTLEDRHDEACASPGHELNYPAW